jgi:4-amino-4-deoxy-L-arabinose transferase-like glycosyltransferase
LDRNTKRYQHWLYGLILLLVLPALLINLGVLTLIDDEALRAWVALEMRLSDNYIVPQLHGEFYYKKPPVYNWMLLGVFQLTGSMDEWSIRIPTVAFLLLYCGTIYYFVRRHFSHEMAFLSALAFLTCGRILFYDSFLGLIDISYSWVTFLSFMVFYHLAARERWLAAFAGSYFLAAVGFLMKGLPSVVFQGFTLIAWLVYQKQFRRLFQWQHILGGLTFLAVVGSYYATYLQYNSLEELASVLFNESAKRTAGRYPLWFTLFHLFTYPFELLIYHFMPWGLLALYLFCRRSWTQVWQHPFIAFVFLTFLVNITVYWTAPKVHPRYVFMIVPLLFVTLLYLHEQQKVDRPWPYRVTMQLLLFCCLILPPAALAPLFMERLQGTPWLWAKSLSLFVVLSALAYGAWRFREARLLTTAAVLLVVRIAFNWFALPDRHANDFGDVVRKDALRVAAEYQSADLRVYKDTEWQPMTSFYMTREAGRIIPIDRETPDTSAYYIIDPKAYPFVPYEKQDELLMRHGGKVYDIVKF